MLCTYMDEFKELFNIKDREKAQSFLLSYGYNPDDLKEMNEHELVEEIAYSVLSNYM